MSSISVRLQHPWLLLLWLPAAALTLWVSLRLPAMQVRPRARWTHLALRLFALLCAALLLSGLSFIARPTDTAMVVLVDQSFSMQGAEEKMQQALDGLLSQLPADTQSSVLSFGAGSETIAPWQRGGRQIALEAKSGDAATDVGQALNAAAAQLPQDAKKRIVLLTDGGFTDGDGLSFASGLAGRGIRLDGLLIEGEAPPDEALIAKITLPADCAVGQPMPLQVTVISNRAMAASIEIMDENGRLSIKQVRLFPGENSFSLSAAPRASGVRPFYAVLTPEKDTIPENNTLGGVVSVTSADRALIAAGSGADPGPLAALLRESGLEADTVEAQQLPTAIAELCRYSLVILLDADALELPARAGERLLDYVNSYGRSLLAVGGRHTFLYGGMKDTVLEQALAVDVEVTKTESEEPVALMLLLDNSASMEGTAITMAKRGAIRSIGALQDNDFVGVITFSTEHSVLSPLAGMDRREQIISDVAALGTVMGTQYAGALLEAERQLSAWEGTGKRHVILLSDGNPSDEGFEDIVARMAKKGVTVSAIALGKDVNRDVMDRIAQIGGGRCYLVESSYDLPAIMLTDTVLTQVDHLVEEPVQVSAADRRWGLPASLPPLDGYIRFSPKADAEVLLKTASGDPLFVRRRLGAGLTAAFASDLTGEWSAAWLAEDAARQALARLIRDLLPAAHTAGAVSAALTVGGSRALLTVSWPGLSDGETLTADVTSPLGSAHQGLLTPAEGGAWTREIPSDGPGLYAVTLHRFSGGGQEMETVETAAVGGWSREYDAFSDHVSRREALQALCAATGGELAESADQILRAELRDLPIQRDPTHALAIAAYAALLLDLALRKLRPRWLNR